MSQTREHSQFLVDTGHHPHGTNIEHIVATLLDEGALGGFHFNARKYADDDLTVGSINPYELFRSTWSWSKQNKTTAHRYACAQDVAHMFDQGNLKNKVEQPSRARSRTQSTRLCTIRNVARRSGLWRSGCR